MHVHVVITRVREHFSNNFAHEVQRIRTYKQASKRTEISAPNSLVWGSLRLDGPKDLLKSVFDLRGAVSVVR